MPVLATIACIPLFVNAELPNVDAPLSTTPFPVNPILLLGLILCALPPGPVQVTGLTVTLFVAAEHPAPAVTTTGMSIRLTLVVDGMLAMMV